MGQVGMKQKKNEQRIWWILQENSGNFVLTLLTSKHIIFRECLRSNVHNPQISGKTKWRKEREMKRGIFLVLS